MLVFVVSRIAPSPKKMEKYSNIAFLVLMYIADFEVVPHMETIMQSPIEKSSSLHCVTFLLIYFYLSIERILYEIQHL